MTYIRTLHDFETELYHHGPRALVDKDDGLEDNKGYPKIVPLRNRVGVAMTVAVQWLWFNQLLLAMFNTIDFQSLPTESKGKAKRAWGSLTSSARAFTNHVGTDKGRADFIRNTGDKNDLPKLFELSCGGNVFELAAPNMESYEGKNWYKVKTLNSSLPVYQYDARQWNRRTHPELFHVATNSTPYKKDGKWIVDSFPQLSNVGYPGRQVIFPVFSANGFNYVEASRVVLMKNGEAFPPYPYNPQDKTP